MRKISCLLSSFVLFCSFVAFSGGTCELIQYPSGEYVIRCQGDGVSINYVEHTNEVYIIQNCEELKANLLSAVDGVSSSITSALSLYDLDYYIISLRDYGNYMDDDTNFNGELDNLSRDYDELKDRLRTCAQELNGDLSTADPPHLSLYQQIFDIECGSCSTNSNDGSNNNCCSVDLSPIITRLNDAQSLRKSITNSLAFVVNALGSYVGGNNTARYMQSEMWSGGSLSFSQKLQPLASKDSQYSLVNMLKLLHSNLAMTQASINNYLYTINTNLSFLSTQSINFFSFFRGEVGVNGALEDWQPQFGSYHDYLTNHYVKSIISPSSLSPSEQEKTNWFSRVETLLAALVFADDSTSTNTVDSSYGNDEVSQITGGLVSISQTSSSQLDLFQQTSDSLISRVRSFSSAFSDASMPSTVRLVKLDNSDSSFIQFESSEISPLVEACHCATTLAWCLGGLILLFWFFHYTVKASYNLVVFIYSVISSIFSK